MSPRHWIRRLLFPAFPIRELPRMLELTFAGALLGGVYGVIHDQITYTISPEYFTCLKFDQFAYANPGIGSPRVFAGIVGFLASWWVGGLTAWVLSRVSLFHEKCIAPLNEMAAGFAIVFLTSMLAAGGGWLWGLWRSRTGYDSGWIDLMASLGVADKVAFMKVCYIHNASYIGGICGTILAILFLARARRRRSSR